VANNAGAVAFTHGASPQTPRQLFSEDNMSLKQAVRQSSERRIKIVAVPFLGDVRIRSLKHSEMRRLRNSFADADGEIIRPRWERHLDLLAAEAIVDKDGNLELTEADAMSGFFDDLDGGAVKFLFSAITEHTGFLTDKGWGAVEQAAKN
jgi:hypothetical protein